MPLKQNPEPVDHATMLREVALDPASGFAVDAGYTSPPDNVVVPEYDIECIAAGDQYTAKVVIKRRASEGDNTSVYLKAGLYETAGTSSMSRSPTPGLSPAASNPST